MPRTTCSSAVVSSKPVSFTLVPAYPNSPVVAEPRPETTRAAVVTVRVRAKVLVRSGRPTVSPTRSHADEQRAG